MGSMSIIEGNELMLRPLVREDLNDFTRLVANPLYGKYSPLGHMTEELAEKVLDKVILNYQEKHYEFWVVMDKKYNTVAGFVGYHPVLFEEKIEEMYFVGFNTKYWGGNFPEKATRFVCNFAFNQDGLSKLIAFVHPDDTAALMCVQIMNAKFEKEALFFGASLFLFSLEKQKIQLY